MRLIDADVLKQKVYHEWIRDSKEIDRVVDSVPTIDAVEVGEWIPVSERLPEEVIPHRNYKYLSDYWCECGWHLGKKGEVKYCAECGRKVNWNG